MVPWRRTCHHDPLATGPLWVCRQRTPAASFRPVRLEDLRDPGSVLIVERRIGDLTFLIAALQAGSVAQVVRRPERGGRVEWQFRTAGAERQADRG